MNPARRALARIFLRWWRAPDHPGKLRMARVVADWLSGRGPGVPVTTVSGFEFHAHPDDWVEREVLQAGIYEPVTLAFLERNIAPGQVILCSGAAYGLHLLVAAKAAGPEGRVVGIDPQPGALLQCRSNIDLNRDRMGSCAPIELVNAGLGTESGILPVGGIGGDSRGNSHLGWDDSEEDGPPPFRTCVDSPRSLLAGLGIDSPPDLAYIDVEGAEIAVLQSFDPDWKPHVLVIEMNQFVLEAAEISRADYDGEFQRLGYQVADFHGRPLEPGKLPPEENVVAFADGWEPVWMEKPEG